MATQAALLLSVVFTFLSRDIYDSSDGILRRQWETLYYLCSLISLLALLLIIGMSTIVTPTAFTVTASTAIAPVTGNTASIVVIARLPLSTLVVAVVAHG